jgi:hypothetical protein
MSKRKKIADDSGNSNKSISGKGLSPRDFFSGMVANIGNPRLVDSIFFLFISAWVGVKIRDWQQVIEADGNSLWVILVLLTVNIMSVMFYIFVIIIFYNNIHAQYNVKRKNQKDEERVKIKDILITIVILIVVVRFFEVAIFSTGSNFDFIPYILVNWIYPSAIWIIILLCWHYIAFAYEQDSGFQA